MSMKGRMLQNGVATGMTATQARAYAKQGLIVQAPSNGPFRNAPLPFVDPMTGAIWMDDFYQLPLNNSDEVGWLKTDIQGTNTATIAALSSSEPGHSIRLTTGVNSGDAISIQWHASIVVPQADGKVWFEARVAAGSNSADAQFIIGLCSIDTTPFASAPSNGVWYENSVSSVLSAHTADSGGAEAATNVSTITAATWTRLGFLVDYAQSSLKFWIDDSLELTYTTEANIPDGRALVPTFAVKGAGAAESIFCDYMKVIQSR